jgi:lipoate-protein ligase A
VDELREEVYSQWSWNYGNSPPCSVNKVRRIEGCGKIEILLDIGQKGKINNIAFYGDFFGNREPEELCEIMIGHTLEYNDISDAIKNLNISEFFHGLTNENFLALLF